MKSPVPSYNNNNGQDDGSYDPRYNDPNFSLNNNNHNQQQYQQPAAYQQPQYQQPAQPKISLENTQSHIEYNQNQQSYHKPPKVYHVSTTITPRIYPPGKLSLNRTPDGFSYSFNKI